MEFKSTAILTREKKEALPKQPKQKEKVHEKSPQKMKAIVEATAGRVKNILKTSEEPYKAAEELFEELLPADRLIVLKILDSNYPQEKKRLYIHDGPIAREEKRRLKTILETKAREKGIGLNALAEELYGVLGDRMAKGVMKLYQDEKNLDVRAILISRQLKEKDPEIMNQAIVGLTKEVGSKQYQEWYRNMLKDEKFATAEAKEEGDIYLKKNPIKTIKDDLILPIERDQTLSKAEQKMLMEKILNQLIREPKKGKETKEAFDAEAHGAKMLQAAEEALQRLRESIRNTNEIMTTARVMKSSEKKRGTQKLDEEMTGRQIRQLERFEEAKKMAKKIAKEVEQDHADHLNEYMGTRYYQDLPEKAYELEVAHKNARIKYIPVEIENRMKKYKEELEEQNATYHETMADVSRGHVEQWQEKTRVMPKNPNLKSQIAEDAKKRLAKKTKKQEGEQEEVYSETMADVSRGHVEQWQEKTRVMPKNPNLKGQIAENTKKRLAKKPKEKTEEEISYKRMALSPQELRQKLVELVFFKEPGKEKMVRPETLVTPKILGMKIEYQKRGQAIVCDVVYLNGTLRLEPVDKNQSSLLTETEKNLGDVVGGQGQHLAKPSASTWINMRNMTLLEATKK